MRYPGQSGDSVGERRRGLEILFVIGQLEVGGAENHIAMIAPALVRHGWRISIYSLAGNGPLAGVLRAGGVEVIGPPLQRPMRRQNIVWQASRLCMTALHLLTALVWRKPAIVHFFLPAAYLVGAPLAALASSPIRVMSRRSLNVYQLSSPLLARFELRLHSTMSAVLGNSRSVVRELEHQEGVPRAKLGLIYNGLDLSRFLNAVSRATVRADLGIFPDDLLFVTVANLIPYKGHADILAALARTNARLPASWRLLVVGRDDGIGQQLKTLSDELGLAGHVHFMGPRADVAEILAASDVGLLCSHQEGFSNAVLEGMAAALPMIVTDVGGNAEAVVDGETGLVVPPKDGERLADALIKLAGDPSLRLQFGHAGRERVMRHFALEQCVEAYDVLYRGLLEGRVPGDLAAVRIAPDTDRP